MTNDFGHKLVWKQVVQAVSQCHKERHHFSVFRFLVWGKTCFMEELNTELYIFEEHAIIGECYFQQVILSFVHQFRNVFTDDEAKLDKAHIIDELLKSESIS